MSHLVCIEHKRRVLVSEKRVAHRSDLSKCETKLVKKGKTTLSVEQVNRYARGEENWYEGS